MKAPEMYEGKWKVFEEKFQSPFYKSTRQEAEKVLNSIRESHPEKDGWVEIEAYVEETIWGFRAVRHHAKYA